MESVNHDNDASMEQQQADSGPVSESAAEKAKERMERWKALQRRAVCAATSRAVVSSSLANLMGETEKISRSESKRGVRGATTTVRGPV